MNLQAQTTIETFEGAQTPGGTYSGSYVSGTSSVTGITWTVILGSIRGGSGNFEGQAALLRAKYQTEAANGVQSGNLYSSTISGGIDNLAFDWNSNGSESGRTWDISIFINDTEIGKITSPGAGVIPAGGPFNRFSIDNLKIEGDFTIKIVNNSTASAADANQYRFVLDNLEWTSYNASTSIPVVDGHQVEIYQVQDAIHIRSDKTVQSVRIYNVGGVLVSQTKQQTIIPTHQFTPGIYLVEVILNDGERVVRKYLYQP
jgi:hypothetical protein